MRRYNESIKQTKKAGEGESDSIQAGSRTVCDTEIRRREREEKRREEKRRRKNFTKVYKEGL